MASIEIHGTLVNIKFLDNSTIVYVNEPRAGYKLSNGTKVEAQNLSWKCIFNKKSGENINKFFGRGSYVIIKGDVLPYMIVNGKQEDGYTIWGSVINHGCYPRNQYRDKQLLKESALASDEKPDVETYMQDDF